MTTDEFDTALVVKAKDGRYLAERIHHMPWTRSLARARLFLDEGRAGAAAVSQGGSVQTIILAEYENE